MKLDIKDRGHHEFEILVTKDRGQRPGTDGGEVHWQNVRKELKETTLAMATAEVKGGNEARLKRERPSGCTASWDLLKAKWRSG